LAEQPLLFLSEFLTIYWEGRIMKMQTKRLLGILAVVACAALIFIGCGNGLVATWELVESKNEPWGWTAATRLELFSDGSGRAIYPEMGTLGWTWSAKNGRLVYQVMGQSYNFDYEIKGQYLTIFRDRSNDSYWKYKRAKR
jgi:hypothetical protein